MRNPQIIQERPYLKISDKAGPIAVESVDILHCCLERGTKMRVTISKPLDLETLKAYKDSSLIHDLYIFQNFQGGFFRFAAGTVNITGILSERTLTIQFSSIHRDRAIEILENLFSGFKLELESI